MQNNKPTRFRQALGKELRRAGLGLLAAVFVGIVFFFVAMPMLRNVISQIGKQPAQTQKAK